MATDRNIVTSVVSAGQPAAHTPSHKKEEKFNI